MILLRAFLAYLIYLLVVLLCLSALIASSASYIMILGVEISPLILGGDMLLATYNLGTKLMRWTSFIDCDRVGVSSLTVC